MRTAFLGAAWLAGRVFVLWLLLGPESWVHGDVAYFADSLRAAAAQGLGRTLVEYPLPAVAVLGVPWLLAGALGVGYGAVLTTAAVATDLGFTVLLRRLATGGGDRATLVWVLAVPLLGSTAYARFDLLPGVLAGTALLLLARLPRTALGLAVAGAGVKLWPALLVPGFLARVRRRRAAFATAAVLAVLLAGATVSVAGAGRLLSPLAYQADRGLQIESVAATPAIVLWWHDPSRWSIHYAASKAYEVTGPGVPVLGALSTVATVAWALGLAYVWARVWRHRDRVGTRAVVWLSLAAVAGAVATGKVLSPQYLLWLLPLAAAAVAVSPGRAVLAWTGVLLLATGCTHLVFPTFYAGLTLRSGHVGVAVLLLVARNVLVGVLAAAAWWQLVRALRTTGSAGKAAGPPGPRTRGEDGAEPAPRRRPLRARLLRRGSGGCSRHPLQHHGQCGDLLGRGIALHEEQGSAVLVLAHSGMFPCFFGGRLSRLVRSSRRARMISVRVSCGWITASTYPRSAAR